MRTTTHRVAAAALHLPSPPAHASTFRSDDLDEVRAFVARSDGEHSRVVHGSGPLSFERHALFGRQASAGWGSAGLAQTIRGAARNLVLQVPIDTVNDYAIGRRRFHVAPGSAMIVAPGSEFTRRGDPGATFVVVVGIDALFDNIQARRPEQRSRLAIHSREIDLRAGDRRSLEAAIADLAVPPEAVSAASRQALGEAGLIARVGELLLRAQGVLRAMPLDAARFAMLQDWIEAHLREPLTIDDLCRAAGVGERSLQLTFASQRGVSPMRYVAERRLAAARRILVRSDPGADVTSVAIAVGFSHLGRFAAMYRQTYGESPSRTIRR